MSVKHQSFISKQLPSFIREGISGYKITQENFNLNYEKYGEDYRSFILFLEAYYEFLESSGNVYAESKNILGYKDIDQTLPEFQKYFFSEFLQYFPEESLTDKTSLVKFAKELYQLKGTPASFQFLFRALFNSDCDIYNTKESVLIASGGKWVRSRYLRIDSLDVRFLNIKNCKIFGETSNSIAKVEKSQASKNKIEIYITDLIREFYSGEYIRIVDDNLVDILFDGEPLRAKIVGSVTKIEINPNYRGNFYKVGDPVVIKGGINESIVDPVKAVAEIGDVTTGAITDIKVIEGSHGFSLYPNTKINFVSSSGSGAEARVTRVESNSVFTITYLPVDEILPYSNTYINASSYGFPTNPTANANTALKDAFTFASFDVYPISQVMLMTPGIGYATIPDVEVSSFVSLAGQEYDVKEFGILSPIIVNYGGNNYSNGDIIQLSGGSGFGAFANVKTVNSEGTIEEVQYTLDENFLYPLGGFLYENSNLPTISIQSQNNKVLYFSTTQKANSGESTLYVSSTDNVRSGMYVSDVTGESRNYTYFDSNTTISSVDTVNSSITISSSFDSDVESGVDFVVDGTAVLSITSILGDGEQIQISAESIGQIKTIELTSAGEDYVTNPEIILKIMDLILFNQNELLIPEENEMLYQGDIDSPNFVAFVEYIERIPGAVSKFILRTYNYNGSMIGNEFYIDREGAGSKTITLSIDQTYNIGGFSSGIKIYGDGTAKANAEFINGTVLLKGEYLNQEGFLSSFGKLQNELYNDFTYTLTVEKEFDKYKKLLYGLIHPAGSKVASRNAVKSTSSLDLLTDSSRRQSFELKDLTSPNVYGMLSSENVLQIYELDKGNTGVYLTSLITQNSYIKVISTNGEQIFSKTQSIDNDSDTIYLTDYTILYHANVAYGYSNGNTFIVTQTTNNFNSINNGLYSNTNNHLIDIVFPGDVLYVSNNDPVSINSIDYTNWIIYANSELNISGSFGIPVLVSVQRNFVSEQIFVEYEFAAGNVVASGNTSTLMSIDGFFITDENDNLIYILTEIN